MDELGTTLIKAILPLPLYWKGRGDKRRQLLLSTNTWLPMHYTQRNNIKQNYHEIVKEWCEQLPRFTTLKPHYTLYFNNRRKKDVDNYTAPLHKFLMDAFVEHGVIADDNYKYVTGFCSKFGGIEDDNYAIVELHGEYEDRD